VRERQALHTPNSHTRASERTSSATIYLLRRHAEGYRPEVHLLIRLNAGQDETEACRTIAMAAGRGKKRGAERMRVGRG